MRAQIAAGLRSYPLDVRCRWHCWRLDRAQAAAGRHSNGLLEVVRTARVLAGRLGAGS